MDSAGQYDMSSNVSTSNLISTTSLTPGASLALKAFEPSFQQDLNGDGVIGAPATVIEAFGSTHRSEERRVGYECNSGGSGHALQSGDAHLRVCESSA